MPDIRCYMPAVEGTLNLDKNVLCVIAKFSDI